MNTTSRKFTLEIRIDSAAFEYDYAPELQTILRRISNRLDCGEFYPGDEVPVLDTNGVSVGSFRVTEEEL